jgi:hypothetical protein
MPEVADFTVGEALSLDERPTYDAVISCGTFLYFPDLPYAEGVLRRMATKAERTMAILDLPDLAKKMKSSVGGKEPSARKPTASAMPDSAISIMPRSGSTYFCSK